MYRIRFGKKIKYYESKENFDFWWEKHISSYGHYYDLIGEELKNGNYVEI